MNTLFADRDDGRGVATTNPFDFFGSDTQKQSTSTFASSHLPEPSRTSSSSSISSPFGLTLNNNNCDDAKCKSDDSSYLMEALGFGGVPPTPKSSSPYSPFDTNMSVDSKMSSTKKTVDELEAMFFGSTPTKSAPPPSPPTPTPPKNPQHKKECIICYSEMSETNEQHVFFKSLHGSKCNHGAEICSSCVDRLPRCPICRDVKPGMEGVVDMLEQDCANCPCSIEMDEEHSELNQQHHEILNLHPEVVETVQSMSESGNTTHVSEMQHPETQSSTSQMDIDVSEPISDTPAHRKTQPDNQQQQCSPPRQSSFDLGFLTDNSDDENIGMLLDSFLEDLQLSSSIKPTPQQPNAVPQPISPTTFSGPTTVAPIIPSAPLSTSTHKQQHEQQQHQQPHKSRRTRTATSSAPAPPRQKRLKTKVELDPESFFDNVLDLPTTTNTTTATTTTTTTTANVKSTKSKRGRPRKYNPLHSSPASPKTHLSNTKQKVLKKNSDNDNKNNSSNMSNVLHQLHQNPGSKKGRKSVGDATKASPSQKPRTRKRTDLDNPFKDSNLSDDDVCDLPFADLMKFMQEQNFTNDMIERGKKHRKRLKNRKQVMSYANRKKVNNEQTEIENSELQIKIANLKRVNISLSKQNKQLSHVVIERKQIVMTTNEANNMLKKKIEELNRQINMYL